MSLLKKLFSAVAPLPSSSPDEACKSPDTNVMRVRAALLARSEAGYKK